MRRNLSMLALGIVVALVLVSCYRLAYFPGASEQQDARLWEGDC